MAQILLCTSATCFLNPIIQFLELNCVLDYNDTRKNDAESGHPHTMSPPFGKYAVMETRYAKTLACNGSNWSFNDRM